MRARGGCSTTAPESVSSIRPEMDPGTETAAPTPPPHHPPPGSVGWRWGLTGLAVVRLLHFLGQPERETSREGRRQATTARRQQGNGAAAGRKCVAHALMVRQVRVVTSERLGCMYAVPESDLLVVLRPVVLVLHDLRRGVRTQAERAAVCSVAPITSVSQLRLVGSRWGRGQSSPAGRLAATGSGHLAVYPRLFFSRPPEIEASVPRW